MDGYPDGSVPTNVGAYQIKLSKDFADQLRRQFPDYDFAINDDQQPAATRLTRLVQLGGVSHTPPASYVVIPAPTTVTINGAEHIQYGQPNTINYGGDNGYTMTITAPVHKGTVDNDHELIYTNVHLTSGDLEFVTTPGKVGEYQVKLSAQGLAKLQALTGASNYDWTQAPKVRARFYVDQKQVAVKITGSQESTTIAIDDAQFSLNVPTGITIPAGMHYQFADGTPAQSGVYKIELTSASVAALEEANPNYHLTVGTDGKFTLDATLTITFQDANDGNKQIGKAITKTGVAGSTIADLGLQIPAGYELAPGPALPHGEANTNIGPHAANFNARGAAEAKQAKLPQTNEGVNLLVNILGSLAVVIALLGLVGEEKKKDNR